MGRGSVASRAALPTISPVGASTLEAWLQRQFRADGPVVVEPTAWQQPYVLGRRRGDEVVVSGIDGIDALVAQVLELLSFPDAFAFAGDVANERPLSVGLDLAVPVLAEPNPEVVRRFADETYVKPRAGLAIFASGIGMLKAEHLRQMLIGVKRIMVIWDSRERTGTDHFDEPRAAMAAAELLLRQQRRLVAVYDLWVEPVRRLPLRGSLELLDHEGVAVRRLSL